MAFSEIVPFFRVFSVMRYFLSPKYLYNRWCRSNIKVLVYGDSGVGKSQFLNTVTGKNAYTTTRTRTLTKHSVVLRTGRKVVFTDTPGHDSNARIRQTATNNIVRGKVDILINLVNFGYQDSELLNQNEAFKVGTSEVKEGFLRDNKKREIQRTNEFLSILSPEIKLKYVFTIVNKADVWFDFIKQVLSYYETGEYADTMKQLQLVSHHIVTPFCSVITPFGNKPMLLRFSEKDKKHMFDNFISQLEDCASSI